MEFCGRFLSKKMREGGQKKIPAATEISGRWGRGSQNLAERRKIVGLAMILKDFFFELKKKKLCYFKVSQFEIFEKHGCPPPFETNASVRNTFTWHGNPVR